MISVSTHQDLQKELHGPKTNNSRISLVPTMGALHEGHLSLISRARAISDIVVCSVFVNPTQFNDKSDLDRYPRTLDKDQELLDNANCDIVFTPTVDAIYPEGHVKKSIDYHGLDKVMEGAHRPGHFDGVVEVVARLFDLVQPDVACFGEKDFQQLAVIKALVEQHEYPIEIISCPIVRESNGLAMSSRNALLSSKQKDQASVIFKTLSDMRSMVDVMNPDELAEWGRREFESLDYCELEYLEIAETRHLQPIFRWKECDSARAFTVVKFGEVRLIDNLEIYERDNGL